MNDESRQIRKTFLILSFLNILPTAFIFGVNTLFLLDGGLNNFQAFAANAFFSLGLVLFEVPTGMIADIWGRRTSYLLGVTVQFIGNLLYLYMWATHAPFVGWIFASILLGLGWTFFSGAVEAWLVDALKFTKHKGDLDPILAKAQVFTGIGMLVGAVAGGLIAQVTNLGMPYVVRTVVLVAGFAFAYIKMKDLGFAPQNTQKVTASIKRLFNSSIEHGFRKPAVRWVILAEALPAGVLIYAFYAAQPYLLDLYGSRGAIGIAGIAAAIIAGAQIVGGLSSDRFRRYFKYRTSLLLVGALSSGVALLVIGLVPNFWIVIACLVVWALVFAATRPARQAYINGLIESEQRATVLSFDSLVGSVGGVGAQPVLGRVADVAGYGASYVVSAAFQATAVPFLLLAKRQKASSDKISKKQ